MTSAGDAAPVPEPVPGPEPDLDLPAPRRASVRATALRVVLLVVAVGFSAVSLRSAWTDVQADLDRLTVSAVALSALALVLGFCLLFAAWYRMLGAMGRDERFGVLDGAEVYAVGQLGKYVPGAVWPAVIQSQMGARRHVGWRVIVGGYTMLVVLTITTGAEAALGTLTGPVEPWIRWVVVAGAVLGLVLTWATVHPDALHRQLDRLLERLTGAGFPERLDLRAAAEAALLCFGAWVLLGAHAAAILQPLGVAPSQFVFVGGSFVLAWVAGIVAVPLPAGIGVREAVLIVTVGSLVGRPTAITLAVVSRLIQVVADLVAAGVLGGIGVLRQRRHARSASPPATS